jgi:type I restriction enzyme S subunit
MSSEVRLVESRISLKDALQFIVDNRGKTAPTEQTGIALIATNCVNNVDLYPQKLNLRFVSQNTYETWFRAHPKPGDILLTNKGSQNGAVCLVPNPVDFCIAQDMVALRADPKKIVPLYLFAALRSDLVQKRIKALNVDAVIPHLKKTDFDKLFIPLPDPSTQEKIGDLYFNLSNRIEILRQTNNTLEAIAQTLFKSWFVDFDPVRAKMKGLTPEGMDEATAALFPDSFEESELGVIAQGWEIKSFSDHFQVPLRNGLTRPKSVRGAGVRMVNMGELFKHRKIGNVEMDRVPLANSELERNLLQSGDLLFARQSLTLAGAGQCSIVIEAEEPRTFESHLIRCRLDSQVANPWFYFYYFLSPQGRARVVSIVEQVAASGIRGSDLARLRVLVPPVALQQQFGEVITPLERRIAENNDECHTLMALRDTLLPRLISGQLRLPEVEAMLAEA